MDILNWLYIAFIVFVFVAAGCFIAVALLNANKYDGEK